MEIENCEVVYKKSIVKEAMSVAISKNNTSEHDYMEGEER